MGWRRGKSAIVTGWGGGGVQVGGCGAGTGAVLRCRADVGENFVPRAWLYSKRLNFLEGWRKTSATAVHVAMDL